MVGTLLFSSVAGAQVPQLISYEGRVAVGGVNFDSATAGQPGLFKFALVSPDGTQTYWSNDGTSVAGSEPTASVALTVTKGLYSVLLGTTAAPLNMSPISAAVFSHPDVRLRVWFSDGTNGSQQLSPDRRIASVAYAVIAGEVADGSVSAAKIAPGAVGSTHLSANAVQAGNIAAGAVGSPQIANGAVGSPQLGANLTLAGNVTATDFEAKSTGLLSPAHIRLDAQHELGIHSTLRYERSADVDTRSILQLGQNLTATGGAEVGGVSTNFLSFEQDWDSGAGSARATRPLTGTVAISGKTVTGTGTNFGLEVRPGETLQLSGQVFIIDDIATATSATVTVAAAPPIPAATCETGWKAMTGTVSVTAASATVTGTGTLFLTELGRPASGGDYETRKGPRVTINGESHYVKTVSSNTSLVLEKPQVVTANDVTIGVGGLLQNEFYIGLGYTRPFMFTGLSNFPTDMTAVFFTPLSISVPESNQQLPNQAWDLVRAEGTTNANFPRFSVRNMTSATTGFAGAAFKMEAPHANASANPLGYSFYLNGNNTSITDPSANTFGIWDLIGTQAGGVGWRFFIAANGNVGIGNSSPTTKLDVAGILKATALQGDGSGLTGIGTSGIAPDAITTAKVADGAVTAAKIASGAVGSGQLAANAVQSASIAAGAVDNTRLATPSLTINTGAGLAGGGVVSLGGALTLSIPNGGVSAAQLAPGAAAANLVAAGIVIDEAGNVGIKGNIDPQYALDVNGDVNVTGAFRVNGIVSTVPKQGISRLAVELPSVNATTQSVGIAPASQTPAVQVTEGNDVAKMMSLDPAIWKGRSVKVGMLVAVDGTSGQDLAYRLRITCTTKALDGTDNTAVFPDPGSAETILPNANYATAAAPAVVGAAKWIESAPIAIPNNVTALAASFELAKSNGGDTNTDTGYIIETRVTEQ